MTEVTTRQFFQSNRAKLQPPAATNRLKCKQMAQDCNKVHVKHIDVAADNVLW